MSTALKTTLTFGDWVTVKPRDRADVVPGQYTFLFTKSEGFIEAFALTDGTYVRPDACTWTAYPEGESPTTH